MASAQETGSPRTADAEVERNALGWIANPLEHFGMSNTAIHSLPREEVEATQLAAMQILLERRRAQIPVLAKLADAQEIHALHAIDDMAPLLFEHKVYKSYPISLLSKQRFDQLTQWLNRLTPYDLSAVDVSQCDSIDGWLGKLRDETPLDAATSSGTSGTMSFFPKTKGDYRLCYEGLRVQVLQKFGDAPTDADLNEKLHVMTPTYRDGHSSLGSIGPYCGEVFAKGDPDYLHIAFDYKHSADLAWLAARLNAAAAKGDVTKVDVPEALLARRGELERIRQESPALQSAFIRKMVKELNGERVLAIGVSPLFHEVASSGLAEGVSNVFGPGSRVLTGGGGKGVVLPDDWDETVKNFFGVDRLFNNYGMTEMTSLLIGCEHDHYHLPPWVVLFVLDPETGQPMPRTGSRTGRAAFFDISHDGTWGGLITGDKITAEWDTPCPCGRSSAYVEEQIVRFSELQGGDDKITCAATPAAQAEALDYLNAF
ncbi:MAG: hypothetical protein H6917_15225 [Novosphingobium sp.]|nr:hypothetical protein [Novosphingobium sp.]MCP5403721.1 hypothetical protein [Novosphingobium sp.]